jgi:hypothetical protein
MHPAIYVIGFIVFALLIVWLARGARGEIQDEGKDNPSKVTWFPDGGGGGPTPGPS